MHKKGVPLPDTMNYAENNVGDRKVPAEKHSFSIPKISVKSKMNQRFATNHPVELYGSGKVWLLKHRF